MQNFKKRPPPPQKMVSLSGDIVDRYLSVKNGIYLFNLLDGFREGKQDIFTDKRRQTQVK